MMTLCDHVLSAFGQRPIMIVVEDESEGHYALSLSDFHSLKS